MNLRLRELVKHSGIYAIGEVVGRLASVVMLPIHTRYLTPADYGVLAILDLSSTLLGILIAGGMTSALARYHQDATSPQEQDAVWWTSFTVTLGLTAVIVLPLVLFAGPLAKWLVGSDPRGHLLVMLMAGSLCLSVVSQLTIIFFRLRMWSWLTMNLALVSLFFNIGLNVYLLVVLGWGITGILVGNLLTLAIFTVVRLAIVRRSNGGFRFDPSLVSGLLRFGTPIVFMLLMATAMHQADRYILRRYLDLDTVGIYSLAYQIGQGLSVIFVVPFATVWSISMYDVARQPDAKRMFAHVFEYFVYGMLLLMFGVSLFIEPILAVFATPSYAGAAQLVPIICFSLVFFSLDSHLRVPALLAKQTMSLVPPNIIGAAANIVLNLVLVPRFGVLAAAWVSVVTYFLFAAVLYLQARKIDRYDYPIGRCAVIMGAMMCSFAIYRYTAPISQNPLWTLGLASVIWCGWAAALAYPLASRFRQSGRLMTAEL